MSGYKWTPSKVFPSVLYLEVLDVYVGQCGEEDGQWYARVYGKNECTLSNTLPEAQAELLRMYKKFEVKRAREKQAAERASTEHDTEELRIESPLLSYIARV